MTVALRTARLTLRVPEPGEALAMLAYRTRNSAHLASTSPPSPPGADTVGYWEARFAAHQLDLAEGRAAQFKLYAHEAPGVIVGSVSLTEVIRGPFQACLLGYGIDASLQGQGLMREAVRAAVDFAFDTWRLHRIMANHLPTNTRSAALLRALGFVVEGYARDYLFIDGAWRDHVLTALTHPRPTPPV